MDDKWIDNIKDRLSEFEMTPPEGLWDSINKEIRQRKLRRWRIWSGATAASVAIISGLYLIFSSKQTGMHEPIIPDIISEIYNNEVSTKKATETFAMETSILSQQKSGKQHNSAVTHIYNPDSEITREEEIKETINEEVPIIIAGRSTKEGSLTTTNKSDKAEPENDKPSVLVDQDEHSDESQFSFGIYTLANGIGSSINDDSFNDHFVGSSSYGPIPFTRMGGGLTSGSPSYGDPSVSTPTATEVFNHKLPLRFSIGISYSINKKFSIDSGITYSFLKSDIKYSNESVMWTGEQQLHFIGIPIGIRYTPLSVKHIDFYASAGAMVEKCIAGSLKSDNSTNLSYHYEGCEDRPFQVSLNAAVGVQYNFSKECGIYMEPGLGYYLKNNSKLRTIYKEHPVTFNINIGVRIGK